MKILSRIGLVATAALLTFTPVLTDVFPADSWEAEVQAFNAGPGKTFKYESEFVMAAPDAAGALTAPEDCAVSPACTLVPIDVKALPDATSPFVMNTVIRWFAQDISNVNTTNDLDIYIYVQRPVINADTGEIERDEEGAVVMEYYEIARAASGSQPERTKLFVDRDETFYYVVQNFIGTNAGFSIELEYVASITDPLFEDLGGTVGPTDNSGGSGAAPTPSFDPGPATPAAPSGGSVTLPSGGTADLPPVVAVPDDFADVDPAGDLNDLLAATDQASRGSLYERREVSPPKPVSSTTALVWLGLFPFVLLGVGGGLFAKFRPTALTVTAPTAPSPPTPE